VALFRFGLCIHDSAHGLRLAAAGRSLRFLRNAMIDLPQREQNEYVGHSIPATISSCRFLISFFTEIALAYEHRPPTDYSCPRRSCFQLTDASLVLFKSVFMAAQLFGTGYIFCAMVLKFFQNCVQFSNDGVKFVTQFLVHPLLNCVKNNVGLIGQKLLRSLGLLGEKLFHFDA
jgi:hypothetical protein